MAYSDSDISVELFSCFVLVGTFTALAFVSVIFSFLWSLRSLARIKSKWESLDEWVMYLPRIVLDLQHRRMLQRRLEILRQRPSLGLTVISVWMKKCIRYKVILTLVFCFLLSLVLDQAPTTFDPYDVLCVMPDAKTPQILKAYRKLSTRYLPNKNKDPDARMKYLQIRKAFKILVDPDVYDEEILSQSKTGETVGFRSILLEQKSVLPFAILFLVPVVLIFLLLGRNREPPAVLRRAVEKLAWAQEQYVYFYHLMGEPAVAMREDSMPRDLIAAWKFTQPDQFELGQYFVSILNEYINGEFSASFRSTVIEMENGQLHLINIFEFGRVHQVKQEALTTIQSLSELPGIELAADLLTCNDIIAQSLQSLTDATAVQESNLKVEQTKMLRRTALPE